MGDAAKSCLRNVDRNCASLRLNIRKNRLAANLSFHRIGDETFRMRLVMQRMNLLGGGNNAP